MFTRAPYISIPVPRQNSIGAQIVIQFTVNERDLGHVLRREIRSKWSTQASDHLGFPIAMINKDTSRQSVDSVASNSMRRSGSQFVTMMQAAQSRQRHNSAGCPLVGLF